MIRPLARTLAAARMLFGAAFVAAPKPTARAWVGKAASKEQATVLTRALGGRDFVLGAGALAALAEPGASQARRWLIAQAVADGTDFAATVAARESLPAGGARFGAAMAAAATVVGLATAVRLR